MELYFLYQQEEVPQPDGVITIMPLPQMGGGGCFRPVLRILARLPGSCMRLRILRLRIRLRPSASVSATKRKRGDEKTVDRNRGCFRPVMRIMARMPGS